MAQISSCWQLEVRTLKDGELPEVHPAIALIPRDITLNLLELQQLYEVRTAGDWQS
jgi:hypothetical protein